MTQNAAIIKGISAIIKGISGLLMMAQQRCKWIISVLGKVFSLGLFHEANGYWLWLVIRENLCHISI